MKTIAFLALLIVASFAQVEPEKENEPIDYASYDKEVLVILVQNQNEKIKTLEQELLANKQTSRKEYNDSISGTWKVNVPYVELVDVETLQNEYRGLQEELSGNADYYGLAEEAAVYKRNVAKHKRFASQAKRSGDSVGVEESISNANENQTKLNKIDFRIKEIKTRQTEIRKELQKAQSGEISGVLENGEPITLVYDGDYPFINERNQDTLGSNGGNFIVTGTCVIYVEEVKRKESE